MSVRTESPFELRCSQRALERTCAAATLIVLVTAQQWHAQAARRQWSATVDETFYLACGVNTYGLGVPDASLAQFGVAPLPIWLYWLPVAARWELPYRQSHWRGTRHDVRMVSVARSIAGWVAGAGALVLVFNWVYRRHGLSWATVAGCLMVGSPTWIAHSSLATTDALAAVGWLIASGTLTWVWRRRGAEWNLVVGAACGLAIAAKYSGVALLPVWFILWSIARPAQRSWSGYLGGIVVFAAAVGMSAWCLHGFALDCVSEGWTSWSGDGLAGGWRHVNLPSPIVGIIEQWQHNRYGHRAMLCGQVRDDGWWYYFPFVWSLKATPSELMLSGVCGMALFVTMREVLWRWRRGKLHRVDPALATWGITLLIGGTLLLLTRIQIGIRYALPLLPLGLMLSVDRLAGWQRAGGLCRRWLISTAMVMICSWQAWSGVVSSPHYLAYMSPWFGGSERAYHSMADSNVDWGQDLPALRELLEELQVDYRRVALSYFGTALPEAYGVHAVPIERLGQANPQRFDYLCISVNHLYGLSATSRRVSESFAKLQGIRPYRRAGYSILLYRAAEVQRAIESVD